ncbi:MAG: DMT family transporter [Sulfurimonas sp.]|nr:DMT family transporter [Sulfurimonas sp.]
MKKNKYQYALVLAMLLWGGGWSALKVLTPHVSMEVLVFWRFFLMSLSFLPILYFLKKPLILNKTSLGFIFASSVLNIAFMIFSYLGVKHGFAGAAGVIITTLSPIMTFLLIALLFRKKAPSIQYFGLFVGVIGGVIMLELSSFELFMSGANIYFLLCAIIWAGVTLLAQYSHTHLHPIHYSFFISVIATILSFFYGYGEGLLDVFEQSVSFWIALLYLAILGQSVATTIFFLASGKLGSQITSSYMFLVPLFALLIAYLLLDEATESHVLIGGSLSLLALYFINKKPLKSD